MTELVNDVPNMDDIEVKLRDVMRSATNNGIMAGVKAMCNLVLDKAENPDKTAEERLQDIVSLCRANLS
jgi:hypothetical protein